MSYSRHHQHRPQMAGGQGEPRARRASPNSQAHLNVPRSSYHHQFAPAMSPSNSTDSDRSNDTVSSSSSGFSHYTTSTSSSTLSPISSSAQYYPRSSRSERSPSRTSLSSHACLSDSPVDSATRGLVTERSSQRYVCVHPGCESTFSRPADLNRHQQSVHFPTLISCPKPRCSRKDGQGFTRQDHLVEHLRQYHGENLVKRSSVKSPQNRKPN